MNSDLIYDKFRNRSKKLQIITDFYADKTFSAYYDSVTKHDEVLDGDIALYRQFFEKRTPVLEIGSGNGRIFNTLFQEGYNIYGLEPSAEMSSYIVQKGRNRIYSLSFQEMVAFPRDDIEVVIIPATSVSLFNHKDFEGFLKTLLKNQSSIKSIVFDFLKESFFEQNSGVVQKIIVEGEKFYSVNFYDAPNNRIIFNLANSKKLGISVKYKYSYQIVKEIFNKYGIKIQTIKDTKDYIMLKGDFTDVR